MSRQRRPCVEKEVRVLVVTEQCEVRDDRRREQRGGSARTPGSREPCELNATHVVEGGRPHEERNVDPVPPAIEEERSQSKPGGGTKVTAAGDQEETQRRHGEEPEDELD